MENKIQQLTEKLYVEGLQKGKNESEQMINKAKESAAAIIAEAQADAKKIIEDANKREEELAVNTRKELALSGAQMLSDVKQSIREILLKTIIDKDVKENFQNATFIGTLIEKLIENWGKSGNIEVPESFEAQINEYLKEKISVNLKNGLVIKPSASVKEGLRVEMENGHYYVNFGSEEFQLFFADYLRPKVAKIIFKEE